MEVKIGIEDLRSESGLNSARNLSNQRCCIPTHLGTENKIPDTESFRIIVTPNSFVMSTNPAKQPSSSFGYYGIPVFLFIYL